MHNGKTETNITNLFRTNTHFSVKKYFRYLKMQEAIHTYMAINAGITQRRVQIFNAIQPINPPPRTMINDNWQRNRKLI